MKTHSIRILVFLLPLIASQIGCIGTRTFTPAVRAGDTVTLAVGYQTNLTRSNMTVTITPSSGAPVTYAPNDPRVRGVVNLYPDPVSGVVVGTQTNQDLGNQDNALGSDINYWITGNDGDWWQTVVLLDLPDSLPTGNASISITDGAGTTIKPATVEVLPGTGSSNLFNVYYPWNNLSYDFLADNPNALKAMERTPRYTVTFSSYTDDDGNEVTPYSIQIEFSRTPGVGKPWVINPRGDLKSIAWYGPVNGSTIKVLLTPARNRLTTMANFKFYIAGGVTGLVRTNFKAYDVNGNLMSGITTNTAFGY